MIYEFNNIKYSLEHDDGKIFDYDLVKELVTDYFISYDYILFDMAYNKLRLKGFCDRDNKKYRMYDIDFWTRQGCLVAENMVILKFCRVVMPANKIIYW